MKCSSITITASGISQHCDDSCMVTVPKDAIRSVKLGHDSRSRRPFLRFFVGFILVASGIVFLTAAFLIAEGGIVSMHLNSRVLGVPVLPVALWLLVGAGLWLIMGVFRGRYTMEITTEEGQKKFHFEESAKIVEINRFLQRANRELGYEIDLSLMNTMLIRRDEGEQCPSR
jgi:hypothetical protein